MNDNTLHTTVLVLGGTGKTGRRIVSRLEARGVPTRVGSRSADPPFSWDDRMTWVPALRGARALYISFYPDLAVPGSPEIVGALAALAVGQGVERMVLLSGRGEEEAERAEQAVRAADPRATIIRSSWFDQNFSESFFLDGVLAGELALPVDGVTEPFVDADDIADVAVAALTESGHEGELYEVTGPRLLSFADAAGEIAHATGRELRVQRVPIDDYAAALRAEGLPDDAVWIVTYLFTEVLDGRNQSLTDGVQRALGRPPKDFRDYAREAAAAGAWPAS
jgi:uncharacterized protein YbjT (DUF2867 family)